MDFDHLHFAHPMWLWGAIAIPLVWTSFFLFFRPHRPFRQLEKFVDNHLLPYLLVNKQKEKHSWWKILLWWTGVWVCLLLALAGPRWSFREIEMMSKDQSLVILLDLSESMNGTDVKPSRLVRAKQKIEDLINLSHGVKIGLIAFAADPHMITPITDDKETIRHLLPSLETDLVHVQGSRLSPALEMASVMLEAEPGKNQALLIISDGDFEDGSGITAVKKIADRGIVIHAMGIGTSQGALLQDHQGNAIKKNGVPILSKMDKNTLEDISKIGHGSYFEGHYSDHEELVILRGLETRAEAMQIGKKNQLWDERFYLMILPVLPIILWWFSRGAIFAMAAILLAPSFAQGSVIEHEYFMNAEELGKKAFDEEEYETAVNTFQDPYKKGVAYYRAGNFAEAEKMFRQSSREEVACDALYNRGNALVQQQKLKKAAAVYEEVLKKWPDHQKAKDNHTLVKKMMEQNKQDDSQSEESDQEEQEKNDSDSSSKSQKSKNSNEDEKNEEDSDQQNEQERNQSDNKPSPEDQDDSNSDGNQQSQENESNQDNEESNSPEEQQQEVEDEQESSEEQTDGSEPEEKGVEEKPISENEAKEGATSKSQEDQDADVWLNRISNDPKKFLKNKFFIESKKNGTTEGIDPW